VVDCSAVVRPTLGAIGSSFVLASLFVNKILLCICEFFVDITICSRADGNASALEYTDPDLK
jgi:hypothetical protein